MPACPAAGVPLRGRLRESLGGAAHLLGAGSLRGKFLHVLLEKGAHGALPAQQEERRGIERS